MHTTLASWTLVIWRALESYQVDPRPVFYAAGLDIRSTQSPGQRLPFPAVQALWQEAVTRTGDPCFGLTTADFMHPTSLHALGYAVLASGTLEDALHRIIRYGHVASTVFDAELHEEGEALVMKRPPEKPAESGELADAAIDAALAGVLQLGRGVFGPELNPLEVGIPHDAPSCAKRFLEYFRAPVSFGVDLPYLVFRKADARLPLPTANAELALANERVIHEYLLRFDTADLATRVRARVAEQLPSGSATESSVAAALHMSSRSMQRRLRDEGISFRTILDEMRRDLATHYVRKLDLSLNEISYLLGYAEPASFTRAFRRWTGLSPSEFRDRPG